MNSNTLSNFDRVLMKQEENEKNMSSCVEENPAYADYLVSQIKRSAPSAEKVMTANEFCASKKNEQKRQKKKTFTRFGKIILASYVLIVGALALLVLVNTYNTSDTSVGATASPVVEEDNEIRKMPLEQESDDSYESLFDKICDSLK